MPINIHSLKNIPPSLESQILLLTYIESEAEMKRLGFKKEVLERPQGIESNE